MLAIVGFFLGHAHGGREFKGNNVHASFAWVLQLLLGAQVVLGLYLKAHWGHGVNERIRKLVRPGHSVLGKAMPIVAWAQITFGGITTMGFCQGDYLGQCAAHFIMGSAFIAYGIVLTIILLVGQVWLRRSGRSQEFYDSAVLSVWGLVNSLTEHHWGTNWVKNDWQHTTIGVIWLCSGLVGMWLSWDRSRKPKRNMIPGAVLFVTGWTMSAHPQELMVSAATHKAFGFALMTAGVSRIVEISFILKDKHSVSADGRSWNSFQFIPIFVSTQTHSGIFSDGFTNASQSLYVAGILLMGATAEQMAFIDQTSMDHVSYILVLISAACIVFLFANILLHLYDTLTTDTLATGRPPYSTGYFEGSSTECGQPQSIDYELHGLMADDEDGLDDAKPIPSPNESGKPYSKARLSGFWARGDVQA